MIFRIHLAAVAAIAAFASPVLAAPSPALFDMNKEVTLTGAVREFQWTNPSTWIELATTTTAGRPTNWSIGHAGRNRLIRSGWKSTSIQAGDQVTVVMHPMKNGDHAGLLVSVTKADGTILE